MEPTVVGEVLHKRTRNSKHYLMSDGSYRAVFSSHDVHFEDVDGNLHNIDTTIYDEADMDLIDTPVSKECAGICERAKERATRAKVMRVANMDEFDFQALKVPFEAKLPRNFTRGYSIGKGADKLTFKPVGASPSQGHRGEKNCITYNDAWNDTDVCLEVTESGIKETIILKSSKSPTTFTFEVEGNLDTTQLKLAPLWLKDVNGEQRDVEHTIRTENGKTYFDIIADVEGLEYPIAIDPTVTIPSPVVDTHISYQNSTRSFSDSQLILMGNADGQLEYKKYHGLIRFDVSSIPAGSIVSSASLYMYYDSWYYYINPLAEDDAWIEVDIYPYMSTRMIEDTSTWSSNNGMRNTSVRGSYITIRSGQSNPKGDRYFSVTDIVKQWIEKNQPNYGIYLSASMYDNSGYSAEAVTYFRSKEHPEGPAPRLIVTYKGPPSAPKLVSPIGAETWNAEHTIRWQAPSVSDVPVSQLRYQIELTTNNGGTWKTLVSLTSFGATSYTYNFINEPESSLCRIRIRAYDGTFYGDWGQSPGVFTIQHNRAPTEPTHLSPNGQAIDRGIVQRLSWRHNDDDGDPQSKFDLQWRTVGTTTWNTVTRITPAQYWDAPANTFPRGQIEWRVRTYDQEDLASPYSAQAVFTAGDKPDDPFHISPTDGEIIPIARPTVQWSSSGQVDYQLQVIENGGIYWDSGEVRSGNKARTIDKDLENNTTYSIRLRIKNVDGLWSEWAVVTIHTSFTTPAIPNVDVESINHFGKIVIHISNPEPTGTEPNVTHNDLYRRKQGETEWIRLHADIAPNSIAEDFTPASHIHYEYYVRSYGDNGTFIDSPLSFGILILQGVWLHDVESPNGTIHQYKLDGKDRRADWQPNVTMMQFVGRKRPVAEFGESAEGSISVQLDMTRNSLDIEKIRTLVHRRATICYRDGRGRKMFGIIPSLPEQDEQYGYSVTLDVIETAFMEGVYDAEFN